MEKINVDLYERQREGYTEPEEELLEDNEDEDDETR